MGIYRDIEVSFSLPKDFSVSKLEAPKVLIPGTPFIVFAQIKRLGAPVHRPWLNEEINEVPQGLCQVYSVGPDGDDLYYKEVPIELAVRQPYVCILEMLEGSTLLLDVLLSFIERGLPIHRLAAKQKILELRHRGGSDEEIKTVSIESNVLSPVTSFVAVIDGALVEAERKKTPEFAELSEIMEERVDTRHIRPAFQSSAMGRGYCIPMQIAKGIAG